MRSRPFEHRPDAARDRDVVVLDQDRIVEPEAMIEAAAAAHRIFLKPRADQAGLAVQQMRRPVPAVCRT